MLTKFESKSNRVKGLAFHPTRPWILASLHNGVIQLWDYQMGTLVDRFEEHDGPVRGVDFHVLQPLFVSGGDDYKIKVWNYKLRRCLFTLLGHLDYIRTVQFHHEYPWILSSSDDQTIRIWNWQSRSSISVLTGHNHYVMCAEFHPQDDLVVSASLDQTVRVWDTSGLRKKTVRGGPQDIMSDRQDGINPVIARVNNDLFGGNDAIVKYVLEGHDRGVNWVNFHHTLPLIVSASDDRQIKLWRMNETKAWEVDTLRGHTNNVSVVLFHPKQELLVSNSEDRSIRVWDISRRQGLQTFRREHDRFWMLVAHKSQNLLAAGHDNGMMVFKLERERPAYDMQVNNNEFFYVKDKYVRKFEYGSSEDSVQVSLRRGGNAPALGGTPRFLVYNSLNPAECDVLVVSDVEGGSYELITVPQGRGSHNNEVTEGQKGQCLGAAFIARNRFAILDRSKQICIKNFRNEVTKKFPSPYASTDMMFPGGLAGRVILRSEDRVTLFDTQARKVVGECLAPHLRYVVWNQDNSMVALLCTHVVMLCNRNLEQVETITETIRVKSGSWGPHGIFVYATHNHIKYCLENGDTGVLRTMDSTVYITKVTKDTVYCLDREAKIRTISIDTTEPTFKVALMRKQYGEVIRIIRDAKLCGQAIISYLQEKGYPEVALHFVEDKKSRFDLAIQCGNLQIAIQTALEVDDKECWTRLGEEALRQGNHKVVEMSYQRTKDFERLSFLYLITGNFDKLRKMLKIAEMRGDVMSRFHNSLYLGDAAERVKILEEVGQLSLAYVTAESHGLEEQAAALREKLQAAEVEIPAIAPGVLLMPPNPVVCDTMENWPLLEIEKSIMQRALDEGSIPADADLNMYNTTPEMNETNNFASEGEESDGFGADMGGDEPGGWGAGEDDLDIDFGEAAGSSAAHGFDEDVHVDSGVFIAPINGPDVAASWVQNSSLAADHVAAGSFQTAMQLLNRQIGVVNFDLLKQNMIEVYLGARGALPGVPGTPSDVLLLSRTGSKFPMNCIRLGSLVDKLKLAYRFFQGGKFPESIATFREILHGIPLCVVNKTEVREVKELLGICREYVTGISLEISRRETEDPARQVELSSYLTKCKLQNIHMVLVLNSAMTHAFKLKNFITAASFAQRLLALPEANTPAQATLKTKATKVLRLSEQEGRNSVKLDFDEKADMIVDVFAMKPLSLNAKTASCPFCGARSAPLSKPKLCPICQLSTIGVETLGLVCAMDH